MQRGILRSAGFTIVEMLVTVVLAGVFLTFFVQMYRANSSQHYSLSRQTTANNIALSNLNKFPRPSSIVPAYVCDTSTNAATNTNNLTINPTAAGTEILPDTLKEPNTQNLPNLTQSVTAYSPMGCLPSGNLIKLESRVTYGFGAGVQQGEAVYATYIQN